MNQRPLNTAYELMTSKELAAVAYAYAGNELESLRIRAAIPQKTYSMLDAEFVNTLERIHTVCHLWSGDYWRLQFLYAVDTLEMAHAHIQGEAIEGGGRMESLIVWKKIIAAHFDALKEVCEAHGINYQTVLARGGLVDNADRSAGVDLGHKAAVIEALYDLLAV